MLIVVFLIFLFFGDELIAALLFSTSLMNLTLRTLYKLLALLSGYYAGFRFRIASGVPSFRIAFFLIENFAYIYIIIFTILFFK
jgi:hypothetical protein